jgi:hypothetical protein
MYVSVEGDKHDINSGLVNCNELNMGNIEAIKVQRQKEIEQGLNAATAYPLYIVYEKIGKKEKFVTLCFTRKAASDFIDAERHNLNKPKIYVEYAERRNTELRAILEILGDKL